MKEQDWINKLKDKMETYEEQVPEGLWNDISSSLPSAKRSRPLIFSPWLWSGVAVAAAVACFFILRPTQQPENPSILTAEAQTEKSVDNANAETTTESSSESRSEKAIEIVSQDSQSVKGLLAEAKGIKKSSSKPSVKANVEEDTDDSRVYSIDMFAVIDKSENYSAETENEAEESANTIDETVDKTIVVEELPSETVKSAKSSFRTNSDGEDWSGRMSATNEKSNSNPVVIDLSFAGALSEYEKQSTYNNMMLSPIERPHSKEDGQPSYDVPTRAPMPAPDKLSHTSAHFRPVRFGLSLAVPVTNRVSFGTGLTYTRMNSTFTFVKNEKVSKDEQTLNYLGIPVTCSYEFLKSGIFSMYVNGGGMVEKCVSGTVKTTAPETPSYSSDLKVSPLLWSLNASAGLQLNVVRYFGIYVEPGLSYHFDDGSEVETIYKEKPLDFVVSLGLRFSFK